MGASHHGNPEPRREGMQTFASGVFHWRSDMKTLTTEQLEQLEERLHAALNPRGEGDAFTWDCEHDHSRTTDALGDMGLSWEQIEEVVEELNDLGGQCDCMVMFNVLAVNSVEGKIMVAPNHNTVIVRHPHEKWSIPIDEQLAPLIRLMWLCGVETSCCCQEARPGLAMISFVDTGGIELFYMVAKRQYFLDASAVYDENEDGSCLCCQAWLEVYFPCADIPRLIEAWKNHYAKVKELKSRRAKRRSSGEKGR